MNINSDLNSEVLISPYFYQQTRIAARVWPCLTPGFNPELGCPDFGSGQQCINACQLFPVPISGDG